MPVGRFFSLEGIDGAGKSTQATQLAQWLRDQGREVVTCRDPGSTRVGDAVRAILLDRHDLEIHRRTEMLLYMAARTQLVEEVIRPALGRGAVVVSDRYLLSNIAYQSYGGGMPLEEVREVGRIATAGVAPDLTIVLDLDVEAAYARLDRQRGQRDRMEAQGESFLGKVRAGFLAESQRPEAAIAVVDATQPLDAIQASIRAAILHRYPNL